jgi:hypothetical protein
MDKDEFMFFLTGGVGLENKLANPDPSWLSDKSWDEICRMCDLEAFKEFRRSFVKDIAEWKTYYDDQEPHKALLPAPWNKKLQTTGPSMYYCEHLVIHYFINTSFVHILYSHTLQSPPLRDLNRVCDSDAYQVGPSNH